MHESDTSHWSQHIPEPWNFSCGTAWVLPERKSDREIRKKNSQTRAAYVLYGLENLMLLPWWGVTKASVQFIRQASKKNTAQEPIAQWLAPCIHASTSGVYVHARNTCMHLHATKQASASHLHSQGSRTSTGSRFLHSAVHLPFPSEIRTRLAVADQRLNGAWENLKEGRVADRNQHGSWFVWVDSLFIHKK
jgi:hypothetical protein